MGTQNSKPVKYGSPGSAQNMELLIAGYLRQYKVYIQLSAVKHLIKQHCPRIYKIFGTGYGSQFGTREYIRQEFKQLHDCEQLICDVNDIYCIGHTFFIHDTIKDELYAIGANSVGQCGIGWTINRREQDMMGMSHWVDNADQLTKVEFIHDNKFSHTEYIQLISNGTSCGHTFIMTNKKRFFVWGNNDNNQISTKDEKHFIRPISSESVNKLLSNQNIIQIATGTSHTLFLSDTGKVYAFGRNDSGCCGFNSYECKHIEIPMMIKEVNDIIKSIKCGRYYSILLSKDQDMIVFGSNSCGQLGLGTMQYCDKPMIHTSFQNKNKIILVDCCCEHTLCIDENGNCYLFGGNMNGQCATQNEEFCYERKTPFCIQTHKELKNIKFISGCCGISHTVLMTNEHKIYAFGSNTHGQVNPMVDYGNNSIIVPMVLTRKHIGVHKKFVIERVMTGLDSTIIIGY